MLVRKCEIKHIDMVENEHNDFCVRFHLDRGCIILPCFYVAGFSLGEMPEADAKQIRLTQEYLDQYPDNAYVELDANILYGMDVYH